MTNKIYCPCCGRFIGDYTTADNDGVCKATLTKPRQTKKNAGYITNICKKCKSEIYILMEFNNDKMKSNELLNEP